MTPSPSSPWEALRAGFRRACVRRLVGDEDGAIAVLRDEIPALVVGWAKTSSLEAPEKKAKLKEVFDDESSRADELAVAFDLFAARFETKVADHVTQEVKKARADLVAVSSKIEEVLARFSQRVDGLTEAQVTHAVSETEPPQVEEATKESEPSKPDIEEEPVPEPTSSEVIPESETKPSEPEVQDEPVPELEEQLLLEPQDEAKDEPVPALEAHLVAPESEPKSESEPETFPATKSKEESMPEPEAESETELEIPKETSPIAPRGIRFDDIEGMIDELLAQEE